MPRDISFTYASRNMANTENNAREEKLVGEYMNNRMVTIGSKLSVLDAAKTMAERNISSIAVTDARNIIIGILTERDIVKIIANDVSPDAITVGSLMSTSPVSIDKNSSLEKAAQLMIKKKIRHLLVEDPENHDVAGVITTTDLARYLKQKLTAHEEEMSLFDAIYSSEEE
jgi:CBS domain-containing protein